MRHWTDESAHQKEFLHPLTYPVTGERFLVGRALHQQKLAIPIKHYGSTTEDIVLGVLAQVFGF
jgi:hypothetical protein